MRNSLVNKIIKIRLPKIESTINFSEKYRPGSTLFFGMAKTTLICFYDEPP